MVDRLLNRIYSVAHRIDYLRPFVLFSFFPDKVDFTFSDRCVCAGCPGGATLIILRDRLTLYVFCFSQMHFVMDRRFSQDFIDRLSCVHLDRRPRAHCLGPTVV